MNLNDMNDAQLWESLKDGNQEAIAYIYSKCSEKIYLFGFRFTSNSEIIEDSIQDLFTGIIKNRNHLGATDNILFYLLRSFRRILTRKIQKENRYRIEKTDKETDFTISWPVEEQIIQNEEQEEKIKGYQIRLNRLTPRQKEVIYLRFTRELKYQEVAEIMGISVESCRNLISKALIILKQ